MAKNTDFIRNWARGDYTTPKTHSHSVSCAGAKGERLLSYFTTIAARMEDGTILLNNARYSQTTTRHQSLVRRHAGAKIISYESTADFWAEYERLLHEQDAAQTEGATA